MNQDILNSIGTVVPNPYRNLSITPSVIPVEPSRELKWYEKVFNALYWFWDSDFMFYIKVGFLKLLQVTCIVLAFYFMNGGRL